MAVGDNEFLYFEVLGNADATKTSASGAPRPDRVQALREFTLDMSTATLITVNEGSGGGEDNLLNDDLPATDGTGGGGFTDDQTIVGGPYDGLEVTVIVSIPVFDSTGVEVGKALSLAADRDGDGNAHETNDIIGYILVSNVIGGQTYEWINGETYTTDRFDTSSIGVDYSRILICFCAGTMIETELGALAIETLAVGDRVKTEDNGYQTIRWIGKRRVSRRELAENSKLRPIRIKAGALGANHPEQDLSVSRQHRIQVESIIAERMLSTPKVLIPALSLLNVEGVEEIVDSSEVTYFHILLDTHEVISANGLKAESLCPGPEALKGVSEEAREEILTLFPEFSELDARALSRHTIATNSIAKKLVARHVKNSKPLLMSM